MNKTVEKKMLSKLKARGLNFDILTDEEKEQLRHEVEQEMKGYTILDGVLTKPDLFRRLLMSRRKKD